MRPIRILMIPASGGLDARLHDILIPLSYPKEARVFSVPFKRWTADTCEQEHNIVGTKIYSFFA